MAKYKVLQRFRDVETNEIYEKDREVELTVTRADEAIENLKGHKGEFLERIDNKEEESTEAPQGNEEVAEFDREIAKERLKAFGIEFKGNASNETLKQLLDEKEQEEGGE